MRIATEEFITYTIVSLHYDDFTYTSCQLNAVKTFVYICSVRSVKWPS